METMEGRGVSVGIESKDGTVLMERNEVKGRWRDNVSELLGGGQTVSSMMEEDQEGVMEVVNNEMLEEEITEEEIRKCLEIEEGKSWRSV